MKSFVPGRAVLAACALAMLLATSACGSTPGSAPSAAPPQSLKVNQQLYRDLPFAIRHRGTLRVITDASYAPASSFAPDGRTIIGFEPDLGVALGKILGIKVVFLNTDFAELSAMVEAGRADMIMSAVTDTGDREKRLDFVSYFLAGTSLVVQRGNPEGISDLASLCGLKVTVETGTVQADLMARQQSQCGDRPMHIIAEPTNDDALLQLRTGRAAALPMDFPPADNLTTQPRTRANYQLASTTQYEPGLYGIGFPKHQMALRDTVHTALAQLITSGAYLSVLKKWNVASGAVTRTSINAAGTGS